MAIYRRFLDGVPEYLARHYWWAYLWRMGIWFFDHQPVINLILFGQYKRLMRQTLGRLAEAGAFSHGRFLQLTCVYGQLTPRLLAAFPGTLHLADVATPQLELARRKCAKPERLILARMNAECLAYAENSFDTILVFFLFHELPPQARRRSYREIARVLKPGGCLLVTEYAERPTAHPLYRVLLARRLLGWLEPFLPGFWDEHLAAELDAAARYHGKRMLSFGSPATAFSGFYRVSTFRCRQAD